MNTDPDFVNRLQTVIINFVLQPHMSLAFTAAADALTTANLVSAPCTHD